MAEPDASQFACIGCGTMNPVGTAICVGCGHHFGGPSGGIVPESITTMANRLAGPEDEDRPSRAKSQVPTGLGCLFKLFYLVLTSIAVLFAFGIAVNVTCSVLPETGSSLIWAIIAGFIAAGAVIALVLWIGSIVRSRR